MTYYTYKGKTEIIPIDSDLFCVGKYKGYYIYFYCDYKSKVIYIEIMHNCNILIPESVVAVFYTQSEWNRIYSKIPFSTKVLDFSESAIEKYIIKKYNLEVP